MKRAVLCFLLMMLVFSASGCNKGDAVSALAEIKNSSVARLELPDGRTEYVDGNISSLKTLADLDIAESAAAPSGKETDWIYRIVFNPSDRVKNAKEITVSFHKDYIQINSEYFIAANGTSYAEILEEWARPKFHEFFGDL